MRIHNVDKIKVRLAEVCKFDWLENGEGCLRHDYDGGGYIELIRHPHEWVIFKLFPDGGRGGISCKSFAEVLTTLAG